MEEYRFQSWPKQQPRVPRQQDKAPSPVATTGIGRPSSILQYSVLRNDEWRGWPEVSIKVFKLPSSIKTLELYQVFRQYGTILRIDILQSFSFVTFSPPPENPFWLRRDLKHPIIPGIFHAELSQSAQSFTVPSPCRKNVEYPRSMTIPAERVEIGVNSSPDEFTVRREISEDRQRGLPIEFTVNLRLKKIELTFSLPYEVRKGKPINRQKASTPHRQENQTNGRSINIRRYLIDIPFTSLREITVSSEHDSSSNAIRKILAIPVTLPPWVFLHIDDVESTHDDGKKWDARRAWARQTDITADPAKLKVEPIGLRNKLAGIDVGRWRTWRVVLNLQRDHGKNFARMLEALEDFNIPSKEQALSKVVGQEPRLWRWLDEPEIKGETAFHDLMYLALPSFAWKVRYQLEACISQGILNEHTITVDFLHKLGEMEMTMALNLLETIAENKQRFYDPEDIFRVRPRKHNRKLPNHCHYSQAVCVTPTTVVFSSPTVEISNRVMREFDHESDRFLRVKFTDEKGTLRVGERFQSNCDQLLERVKRAMTNGIVIGTRKYEFLACGNSQFREHAAYFYCPSPDASCDHIRRWLGDFRDIKTVAKYNARLGQAFSTTRAISGIKGEVYRDYDVKTKDGQYTFTDGVGKMSKFIAQMVAYEFKLPGKDPPSLYQFRLGGCKGVLVMDPELTNRVVIVRDSQLKFNAMSEGLEVIRVSSFASATLNRQLILILSALGVSDEVFLDKQSRMLADLDSAMVEVKAAVRLLRKNVDANHITLQIAAMILDGFVKEPFVATLMQFWRAWNIKYLKEKAKIPIEKGAFLLGCVDETDTLRGWYKADDDLSDDEKLEHLPEIFLQVSDPENKGHYCVIEGVCLVARNPSLHPGDVRVVKAVNVAKLYHLKDVVVFPRKGDRDIPNMCSGGDLDGDDYVILWDPDLMPLEINHAPMDFTPDPPKLHDGPVTTLDLIEFFVDYIKNSNLGIVATSHVAWADQKADSVKSEECLHLSTLHSIAVDYPKSGRPAIMPRDLHPRKWPHFMEKAAHKTYRSGKVLGKLYDHVERVRPALQHRNAFDQRILDKHNPDSETLKAAEEVKEAYDAAVRRIMAQYEIESEFEVWTCFILGHASDLNDYKLGEELGRTVSAVKEQFQKACKEKAGGADMEKLEPFVAAMYHVTRNQIVAALPKPILVAGKEVIPDIDTKDMPLISFPWLFPHVLGQLANGSGAEIWAQFLDPTMPFRPFKGRTFANQLDKAKPPTPEPAAVADNDNFIALEDWVKEQQAE